MGTFLLLVKQITLVLNRSPINYRVTLESAFRVSWVLQRPGGDHPKKTKKNQSLHQNRQIGIGFCCFFFVFLEFPNWHWFFWFFFGFFGIGFGQNSKLETGFFLVFLGFFGLFCFFWLKLWPTFEIGNWFLVFFGFFWDFLVFFGI